MAANQEGTLHVLHTNDIHSHFEEMARIATGCKSLRQSLQEQGHTVVTVDVGDHMDRMRLETEATWGQANIEILNVTGYDIVTVGNNEGLTFPREEFDQLYRNAAFSVVCANLLDAQTNGLPPYLQPYVIKRYGDFTVGWIGVTAPFAEVYKLLGLEVYEHEQVVADTVALLRSRVDAIIVLSHVGYRCDVEMARTIQGIDVILGAHTHTYLPKGEYVNNTLICQTGKFGQNIGHLTIRYDRQTKHIIDKKTCCVSVQQYEPDQEIEAIIQFHRTEAETIMGEVVTRLHHPLPVSWKEESSLANLLAAGLRSWVGADIGMVNSGTLLFSLPSGQVTRKDLLELCPHPINPCRMKLTGKQLLLILEESLDERVIQREVRGFGFRGKIIGRLSVDGADIYYRPDAPLGQRIAKVHIQGRPLKEDYMYTVGTIDMFTFGIVFPEFTQGKDIKFYVPEFLRDVLREQLQKQEALEEIQKFHWHAI
jgi:5'-nucleotidase